MLNVKALSLSAVVACSAVVPVHAANLSAEQLLYFYNLISVGDASVAAEVEGNIYVGGNLLSQNGGTSTGGALNTNFIETPTNATLKDLANTVVLGDVYTGLDFTSSHGDAHSASSTAVIGGSLKTPALTDNNFTGSITEYKGASIPTSEVPSLAYVKDTLDAYSASLASQANSGTYNISSNGQTGVFSAGVYTISMQTVSGYSYLAVQDVNGDWQELKNRIDFTSIGAEDKVVFNVIGQITTDLPSLTTEHRDADGKDIYQTGDAYAALTDLGYALANQVTWNFVDATEVNFSGKNIGNILAPNGTVKAINGSYEGSIYALSAELANGELHNIHRTGDIPGDEVNVPVVPVPATLPLLLGGIGALSILRRKRA